MMDKENKVKVTFSDMVYRDTLTGVEKKYNVNTFTKADQAELLKHGVIVRRVTAGEAKADTGKKLPPPPAQPLRGKRLPPPPRIKVSKVGKLPPPPPPPLKAPKVEQVEIVPPAPAAPQVNRRPPPPIPYDNAYGDLINYMSKYTRYPTVAYNNKVNGHVILSLVINNAHKVTDVKVVKGIGSGCEEEAARALKSYSEVINKAPGTYKIAVTFMLQNDENTKFIAPKPLGPGIDIHNIIGQVVIAGFLK